MRSRRVGALSAVGAVAFTSALTHAQEPRVDEQPRATAPPLYQTVRYLEDDESLARQAKDDFWAPLKRMPLGDDATLSWGGQHRVRYELVEPSSLGVGLADTRSALLVRNLLHADLRTHDRLRLFVQAGSWLALGVDGPEPPDADDADIAQAFVEARAELGTTRMILRVGRQEMTLGSGRWVSLRDGANMRLAFDLVRATLLGGNDAWKVEAFGGVLPGLQRGAFDDAPEPRNRFWGAYGTVALLPKKVLAVDAFYLGRGRDDVAYREIDGDEVRHTLGVRVFGEAPFGLEYIAHGLLQLGAIDVADIVAWGFAGALWKTLPEPLGAVRLGLRGDALSGDGRAGDDRVSTFQPLFPNQTFFAVLPAFYPSNLYDLHPLLRVDLGSTDLEGGAIFFWRQQTLDAIYQPPGQVAVPGDGSRAAYTAAQVSIGLSHQAARHVAVSAEYSHVFAGPGLVAGGGRDVDFFGTWTTYTY